MKTRHMGLVAFFLSLLFGGFACYSEQTPAQNAKTAQNVEVVTINVANDTWLLAANTCVALTDNACAKALIPAHRVLLDVSHDLAQGEANVCRLMPVVAALQSAGAIPGMSTKPLQDGIDTLAALLTLCSVDAGSVDAGSTPAVTNDAADAGDGQ